MLNSLASLKRITFLLSVLSLMGLSGCKGGFGGSTDAGLARLSITPGNMQPAFAKETYEYTVTLAMSEDSFIVNARVSEDDATMQLRRLTGEDGSVEETFDLSDDADSESITANTGSNYFDILVTSGNESTKTYEINVVRQSTESNDASLASLEADGMNIDFESSTADYQNEVNYFINSTRLKATLSDSGARFESFDGIGNLSNGAYSERQNLTAGESKKFNIQVKASDLTTTQDYSLEVSRKIKDDVTYRSFLKASDASNNANFGYSVDVFENLIVVGAPGHSGSGHVYFFRPSGDSWAQEASFLSVNQDAQFGFSVAAYGSTVAVGAPGEANGEGRVFVYRYENETWELDQTITAGDRAVGDRFGSEIAINGPYMAIAADGANQGAGKVYMYRVNNFDWAQRQIISSQTQDDTFLLGASIALVFNGENELIVGAPQAAGTNSEENAGAVHVFKYNGNNWIRDQSIRDSAITANAEFGRDVDAIGDTLVVGAPNRNTQGSVVIFERSASSENYTQEDVVTPESTQAMAFGSTVALFNESMLAVGAPAEDEEGIGRDPNITGNSLPNAGAVFIFGNNRTTGNTNAYEWSQEFYWKSRTDTTQGDRMGAALAAHRQSLVIGLPDEDTSTGVVDATQNNSGQDVGGVFVLQ